MKRAIYIFSVLFVMFVLFLACSEDSDPLASKSHTESWNDAASEDFHGTKVITQGTDFCTSCHGNDFEGGESKVACYDCHETFPHKKEWLANSDFSHNDYLKSQNWNTDGCAKCHGSNFGGGSSKVSCYTCHNYPHNSDWTTPSALGFHGMYVKNRSDFNASCANCHGGDFRGGNTGVSCWDCHNGPNGPTD